MQPPPLLGADVVSVLVPAVLAFIAAVVATAVGYRQWKKQHAFDRSKTFLDDRAAAYKELWSRLEAIDVRLRQGDVRDEEFDDALRELNSFVLASEIYFDVGIRTRVKTYLDTARHVSKVIKSYPAELQRARSATEELAIDPLDMRELAEALKVADDARAVIMTEVRTNLGA